MKAKTEKAKTLLVGLVSVATVSLAASQFDDVKFWFNGGKLSHGAGTAATGDFFDAAHAGVPSHKNHTSSLSWGYEENRQLVMTDVTIPMTGETRTMQVLRLANAVHNVGGVDKIWPTSVAIHNLRDNLVENGVATNTYTLIFRLRRSGNINSPGKYETFLNWGYDGYGGLMVRFSGTEDTSTVNGVGVYGKFLNIYRGLADGTGQIKPASNNLNSDPSLFVPTNVWVDIGISVSNNQAQIVIVKPKAFRYAGTERWRRYAAIGSATFALDAATRNLTGTGSNGTQLKNCMFILGAPREWQGNYEQEKEFGTWNDTSFTGDIQQFAIWNRALSKQDMLDAFGEPRPYLVRVGLGNGNSSEFGGERTSGGERAVDTQDGYGEISSVFMTNDKLTVAFIGRPGEAGLRQYAFARAVPGSATGRFSLLVNGVQCGERLVRPTGTAVWCVPQHVTVEGRNTVILKRVDSGSGAVELDNFSLGGSWQIGVAGDGDGYSSEYDLVTDSFGGANVNPALWPGLFTTYERPKDVPIRFWVDEVAANNGSSRFTIPITMRKVPDNSGEKNLQFSVNGVLKLSETVSTATWPVSTSKTITLDFMPNELNPGWNEIRIQFTPFDNSYSATVSSYTSNDYYRFEYGNLSTGTVVIIR